MAANLARLIDHASVSTNALRRTHGSTLDLFEQSIGVAPNGPEHLGIWPPGLRTYSLIVPSLLNLPALALGRGGSKHAVGLGMHVASRAAGSAACDAQTRSFAVPRDTDAVDGDERAQAEAAVTDLAEAIGSVPHGVTNAKIDELRRHHPDEQAEWIVLGTVLMGFTNKFMDALGVEPGADPPGPIPGIGSFRAKLRVLRRGRAAARQCNRWLRDVPERPADARVWLRAATGYDEPLIERFSSDRVGRALTGATWEQLNPETTELGIPEKALVAVDFARYLNDRHLIERTEEFVDTIGADEHPASSDDRPERWGTVNELAWALSPSPAVVDDELAERAAEVLTAPEIVELVTWLSVLQMWHRWSTYISPGQPDESPTQRP